MTDSHYKVIFIAFLFIILASCSEEISENNQADEHIMTDKSHVEAILDTELSLEERSNAINELKENGDWESLVKALPPQGGYGQISVEVMMALGEIGNKDAIPYLEKVSDTDRRISGDFWIFHDHVLSDLKGVKSNRDRILEFHESEEEQNQ